MGGMNASDRLRLQAGVQLLAERKGVPVSEITSLPVERIERDLRAARVTLWDIARQVAIARKLEHLYEQYHIPRTLLLGQAVELGYLGKPDAMACYAVTTEDIDTVIRENHWSALA